MPTFSFRNQNIGSGLRKSGHKHHLHISICISTVYNNKAVNKSRFEPGFAPEIMQKATFQSAKGTFYITIQCLLEAKIVLLAVRIAYIITATIYILTFQQAKFINRKRIF